MKSLLPILLFGLLLLSSCRDNKNETETQVVQLDKKQTTPFNEFLRKFQITQLPFYYKGWIDENIDISKLATLDQKSNDTLFFNINDENIKCYGILADTTNFYSLIYFKIGDAPVPILATYSKIGQLLDRQDLLCNGCGSDCGLLYCSYTAQIKKTLDIYIADTAIYNGLCDSLQEDIIKKIDSTFIEYKVGKIDVNGKIVLGQTQNVRKKNSNQH